MKKEKLIYGILAVCIIIVAIAWIFAAAPFLGSSSAPSPQSITATTTPMQTTDTNTVQLDGQTIHVTVASTDAERQLGLGGRSGLAPDEGMLFVFQSDGEYGFWMKDMSFSIDMVWISADKKIIYMAQNVSPDTYPEDFVPTSPARYVLELPAGYTAAHQVKLGDVVQL